MGDISKEEDKNTLARQKNIRKNSEGYKIISQMTGIKNVL
jgi:hypothetical protein